MSSFRLILHILGLVITGALALFFGAVLALQMIAVAAGASDTSRGLSGLLGTLFGALVCLAVFLRLLRSVRAG